MDKSGENDIYFSMITWFFLQLFAENQTHVSNREYLPLSSYNHSLGQIPIWFALPSFPLMICNCFPTLVVGRNTDQSNISHIINNLLWCNIKWEY